MLIPGLTKLAGLLLGISFLVRSSSQGAILNPLPFLVLLQVQGSAITLSSPYKLPLSQSQYRLIRTPPTPPRALLPIALGSDTFNMHVFPCL